VSVSSSTSLVLSLAEFEVRFFLPPCRFVASLINDVNVFFLATRFFVCSEWEQW
jgi:hypothetical protein